MADWREPELDDEEAKSITAAVVARLHEKYVSREPPESLPSIAEIQQELLSRPYTWTVFLRFGSSHEKVGFLTLDIESLIRAVASLRKGASENDQRSSEWAARLHVERAIETLEDDINEWLRAWLILDLGYRALTRDEFLFALERWPPEHALELLSVPSVRRQIQRLRRGRSDKARAERKRLRKALARLAADPERRGPSPRGAPAGPGNPRGIPRDARGCTASQKRLRRFQ